MLILESMEIIANLSKMETSREDTIRYVLSLGNERIGMNELLGQGIQLEWLGKIHCIKCGRETRKSFAQGYCYPCFTTAPETEDCVLRPELCRAHEGVARDMSYAEEHCLSEQVVYLSVTSGLKVGVTRGSQVPTRWIDQGAHEAIEIVETPNRYLAGITEVALKEHVSDKTQWRKMLTNQLKDEDLFAWRERLRAFIPEEAAEYFIESTRETEIHFPVLQYPEKIRSLNLDKTPEYSGTLKGIKGQYLIFEDGTVFNVRGNEGYYVGLAL